MTNKAKGLASRFATEGVEYVPSSGQGPARTSNKCPFKANWNCPDHFRPLRDNDPDDLQICILCGIQQLAYDIYKLRR